jgi:V/A-type H+-transporting ATPase subunit C
VSADNVALADSGDALADLYRATRVGSAVDAAASAVSGGSLTAFEKACDNAVMQFVREAKIMRFGAAHVVSYLAAMENEATAARMILAGRQAGLKPDTLRERLRDTYA